MEYDVYNWYWIVGSDEKRVYASSDKQYVSTSDSNYRTWISEGGIPTKIASHKELMDMLRQKAPELIGIRSPEQFFDLFTKQQWKAIKEAAKKDEEIEYLMDRLRVVRSVDPTSQTTIDGVNYLVGKGLISQDDAARILNP